jgi:hypothetical protein
MNALTEIALPRVALRNLALLDYGNGFTLWHYRSQLAMADVLRPGFFDDARGAGMINVGDHILVSARDGGGSLYVTADRVLVMAMATEAV